MSIPSGSAGAKAETTTSGLAGNRSLVVGLAVTETVSWGVLFYALPVLLVPMERDLGWSRSLLVGAYTLAIVLSGLAAPIVGRWIDRAGYRALMTLGSAAGACLVLAWSSVTSPWTYYLVWIGIGAAKATVLYEVAFTVLAKRCAPNYQRPMLVVTLTAGLASFIFQPLTSTLSSAYGWRTALVILALVLAAVTVPIHWAVLRDPSGPRSRTPQADHTRPASARHLGDRRLWALTGAFTAVTMTSFAASVLLVVYLVDQEWTVGAAALAGGTLGAMQLPGRLAFGPLANRLSHRALTRALFSLPGLGVAVLLLSAGNWLVWAAVVLLGVGQGTVILLRAVILVDLYGTAQIGALNGMVATPVTLGRALAPLGATLIASATGSYAAPFLMLILLSLAAALIASRALRPSASPSRAGNAI